MAANGEKVPAIEKVDLMLELEQMGSLTMHFNQQEHPRYSLTAALMAIELKPLALPLLSQERQSKLLELYRYQSSSKAAAWPLKYC